MIDNKIKELLVKSHTITNQDLKNDIIYLQNFQGVHWFNLNISNSCYGYVCVIVQSVLDGVVLKLNNTILIKLSND